MGETIFQKLVSKHGSRLYLTRHNETVARGGFVAGGLEAVGNKGGGFYVQSSPATVAKFDDFVADTGNAAVTVKGEWRYTSADTGHKGPGIVPGTGGVLRLENSATQATEAPSGVHSYRASPQWKMNQGRLHFIARVKISDLTDANAFIGLTDTGANEMPLYDTGAGILATATNAIGFVYGNQSTGGEWKLGAVNAGTVVTDTGVDPVANTYDVLEFGFEDTGGPAYFYQNGELIGTIASPVLPTRALVPSIAGFAVGATTSNIDVDYIGISAGRDTGL